MSYFCKWYVVITILLHYYHVGYIDGFFYFHNAINDGKVVYATLKHTFYDIHSINLAYWSFYTFDTHTEDGQPAISMAHVDSTLNITNHYQIHYGQLPGEEIMPMKYIPFRKVEIRFETAFYTPPRYYWQLKCERFADVNVNFAVVPIVIDPNVDPEFQYIWLCILYNN